jgi:predicted nucleic acid-binding protein
VVQVVLDSDIFSEILARRNSDIESRAATYFSVFGNFTISALTLFEVQRGLTYQHKSKIGDALSELMRHLIALPIRREEAELAGTMHGLLRLQGTPIGDIDPLIAATAITYDVPLATGNIKHYRFLVEAGFPLRLENWREP